MNFLLALIGGGIGLLVRCILGSTFGQEYPYYSNIIVNIVICFLIGMLFGFVLKKCNLNKEMTAFLMAGFCLGFSILSAFSLDIINVYSSGHILLALFYLTVTIVSCVVATALGVYIVKKI